MTAPGRHREWDFYVFHPAWPAKNNARLAFCIFKAMIILLWFRCAAAAFSVGTRASYNSGHETSVSPEN